LAVSHIKSIATSKALGGRIIISSLSEGLAVFTPGELLGSGQ
jgi:hypothetical protein